MAYSWEVASRNDFAAIYGLLYNSDLKTKWSVDDVRRRVIVPLFLGQLLAFRDAKRKLCGFLTYAFMNKESAAHQPTVGVQDRDWRSGGDFWVVDFVSSNGDGRKMLRSVVRDMDRNVASSVHYFRLKYQQLRKVRPS